MGIYIITGFLFKNPYKIIFSAVEEIST